MVVSVAIAIGSKTVTITGSIDSQSYDLEDDGTITLIQMEDISNCCNAPFIVHKDLCSHCQEHSVEEEIEEAN